LIRIGIDSGGTFTDSVIFAPGAPPFIGKALSTPERPALGCLESVADAAKGLGLTVEETLQQTGHICHGTTVGLNTLLTGTGARVAFLTTAGFEDTLAIARINKAVGLEASASTDASQWDKPRELVQRSLTFGIPERVASDGAVVHHLDERASLEVLAKCEEAGAESVAISLLWSFLNPTHERRLAELAAAVLPQAHLSLSSDLAPRMGEYARASAVALNGYIGPRVQTYLADLETQLREAGFSGSLFIMHSGGGVKAAADISRRPIETLLSGPIGGLSATVSVGKSLNDNHIVSADVGGTSFDVGLVVAGREQYAKKPMIGRYPLATRMVDIESVGTGGGSIAWVDPAAKTLRVGPASAGAEPGPVSYGRGGTLPTVTDAAVVLGHVVKLAGDLELDRSAAESSIAREIAGPLGVSVREAAEGILRVATAQMSDLVRAVTVHRGHDIRRFTLYAFGGAGPQYVCDLLDDLGIEKAVVPSLASVFSAYGGAASDLRAFVETDAPQQFPPAADWLNDLLNGLQQQVQENLSAPANGSSVRVTRELGMRFHRQVHDIRVPVPAGQLSADSMAALADSFVTLYEHHFGSGTAHRSARMDMSSISVEASVALGKQEALSSSPAASVPESSRLAWFNGSQFECRAIPPESLVPGETYPGPLFVELPTTTVVVRPGHSVRVDTQGNIHLLRAGEQS
jgi:N-methylhydantoinase A